MTLISTPDTSHHPTDAVNGVNGTANGIEHPVSNTSRHSVLLTSQSGTIALITSLSEASYRRLGALQTALTPVLDHTAGLNPRAHRSVESEGLGSRGVVDGNLVERLWELGSQRRMDMMGRCGAEGWEVREELGGVGKGALKDFR